MKDLGQDEAFDTFYGNIICSPSDGRRRSSAIARERKIWRRKH